MPDVLDDILDMLPQSTLDLMMKHHGNASSDFSYLDEIINDTLGIRIRCATAALQKRYLDRKFKSAENSNALAKLLKELEVSESNDFEEKTETLEKKLSVYDEKIKEIARGFGSINCPQLFDRIENLRHEKEELKKNLSEISSEYECFDGIPPNIEELKKAIQEIKQQIRDNEEKIDALF